MTPSGDDEEVVKEAQEVFNRLFAVGLAHPNARYVLICHGCNNTWGYETDAPTVKAARSGDAECDCGSRIELARDTKAD